MLAAWLVSKGLSTNAAGILVKIIIILDLILALVTAVTSIYYYGRHTANSEWEVKMKVYSDGVNRQIAAEKESRKNYEDAQKETIKGLRSDLKTISEAKEKVKVVIREVEKYVTKEADSKCVVTDGFVWLSDLPIAAEATGVSTDRPGDVNADSGIKLSEVAKIQSGNNAECVSRGKIIGLWQKWYIKSRDTWEAYRASLLEAPPIPQ